MATQMSSRSFHRPVNDEEGAATLMVLTALMAVGISAMLVSMRIPLSQKAAQVRINSASYEALENGVEELLRRNCTRNLEGYVYSKPSAGAIKPNEFPLEADLALYLPAPDTNEDTLVAEGGGSAGNQLVASLTFIPEPGAKQGRIVLRAKDVAIERNLSYGVPFHTAVYVVEVVPYALKKASESIQVVESCRFLRRESEERYMDRVRTAPRAPTESERKHGLRSLRELREDLEGVIRKTSDLGIEVDAFEKNGNKRFEGWKLRIERDLDSALSRIVPALGEKRKETEALERSINSRAAAIENQRTLQETKQEELFLIQRKLAEAKAKSPPGAPETSEILKLKSYEERTKAELRAIGNELTNLSEQQKVDSRKLAEARKQLEELNRQRDTITRQAYENYDSELALFQKTLSERKKKLDEALEDLVKARETYYSLLMLIRNRGASLTAQL